MSESPRMAAELLTAAEVAAELRLDRETVCEMLRVGELRGFKPRGQWRVRRPDLERFVALRMNDAPPPQAA